MIFSVSVNLAVLGFFKYFGFFVDSAHSLLHTHRSEHLRRAGARSSCCPSASASTSSTRSATRSTCTGGGSMPRRNLITYAVVHRVLPATGGGSDHPRRRTCSRSSGAPGRSRHADDAVLGAASLIMSGLFKKVVLADSMAPIVNGAFDSPKGQGAIPLGTGHASRSRSRSTATSPATPTSRAASRVCSGIEHPAELRTAVPLAQHHRVLADVAHLAVELGCTTTSMSRSAETATASSRTYRNLIITMLLGGLWHGASWTFVIWGGLNGIALAVHRAWRGSQPRTTPVSPGSDDILAILGTFTLVSCLWVFFRAGSFSDALSYFSEMSSGLIGPRAGAWKSHLLLVGLMGITMLVIDLVDRRRRQVNPLLVSPMWFQGGLAGAAVIAVIVWSGQTPTPFIYFKF